MFFHLRCIFGLLFGMKVNIFLGILFPLLFANHDIYTRWAKVGL